jgi:hypothetical protein
MRWAVPGIAAITLAVLVGMALQKNVNPSLNDFDGKFVTVNCAFGDNSASAILRAPTYKQMGTHGFLVGELVFPEGPPVVVWLCLADVESLSVFPSKEEAMKSVAGGPP